MSKKERKAARKALLDPECQCGGRNYETDPILEPFVAYSIYDYHHERPSTFHMRQCQVCGKSYSDAPGEA